MLSKTKAVKAPFDWRAHLPVHSAADLFPLMSESELKELADDIKQNGLLNPIQLASTELLDESGKRTNVYTHALLDGRNRLDALAMLGWLEPAEKPKKLFFRGRSLTQHYAPIKLIDDDQVVNIDDDALFNFGDDGGENSTVISLNIRRRHLTVEQKRDVIAKLLKAQPETSDRQIAKTVAVDHHKVGDVRRELESTGEISPVEKTVGADGKSRKKPIHCQKRAAARNGVTARTVIEEGQAEAPPTQPEPKSALKTRQKRLLADFQQGVSLLLSVMGQQPARMFAVPDASVAQPLAAAKGAYLEEIAGFLNQVAAAMKRPAAPTATTKQAAGVPA